MSVADGHERSKPQHLFVVLALLYRLAISTSLAISRIAEQSDTMEHGRNWSPG
jgi:hypothetical protein